MRISSHHFESQRLALRAKYILLIFRCGGTGCSGKNVFAHNSLQPLPRLYRCKNQGPYNILGKNPTKLSTQWECTVTPIGW